MRVFFRFWALAAIFLGPACGGGGGGGGGGPADFAVTFSSPASGTAGVSKTQVIYVRFNRAVNGATVSTSSFTLADSLSQVAGTVTYLSCNNMAKLEPSSPLGPNTAYTAKLTSAILDTGGMALSPYSFTFTTGGATDIGRPAFGGAGSAAAASTTSITVFWAAATDNLDPASLLVYDVFLSTTSGCYDFTAPIQTTAAGATSATVGSLLSNTTYFFVVRARDTSGNVDLNEVQQSAKTQTSFAQGVWAQVVGPICSNCHTSGLGAAVLAMSSPSITRANWVNVNAACATLPAGTKRVLPSNSDQSFVYKKVNPAGSSLPMCGSQMPQGGIPLDSARLQILKSWIDEGALDN